MISQFLNNLFLISKVIHIKRRDLRESGVTENVWNGVGGRPDMCALFYLLQYHAAAAAAKSCQSCPTSCDPTDGSPPGSPVPGILQARILEWVAISFSNAAK